MTFFEGHHLSTQPVDSALLLDADMSSSDSFEISSKIWTMTLCKLLDALPMPALLLDESFQIIAANQACASLYCVPQKELPFSWPDLFEVSDAETTQSILEEVLSTGESRVVEALLLVGGDSTCWRLTFRLIKITERPFVLVSIENAGLEKKVLLMHQRHIEEMHQEITDQKLAEKALQIAHEKSARLLQTRIAELEAENIALRESFYATLVRLQKPLFQIRSTLTPLKTKSRGRTILARQKAVEDLTKSAVRAHNLIESLIKRVALKGISGILASEKEQQRMEP
ncbi:MAG TPA: PAS domain-containing protein [Desulfomonilaceae bacterium]|nr:PAS domain-containing protein [Desulfomonilaceae bacterium]